MTITRSNPNGLFTRLYGASSSRCCHSFADQRQAENADSIAAGSKFTETYHTYEEVEILRYAYSLTKQIKIRLSGQVHYAIIAQIIDYLNQLAGNNSMVSVSKIGESDEVRDIVTAHISSGGGDTKPAIYLECGMHAREWIAHSTCLWIIDEVWANFFFIS